MRCPSSAAGCPPISTDRSAQDVHPPEEPGTDIMRAEATAAYTRSILAPLVNALEHSEGRVAELERENGTLIVERDVARSDLASAQATISTLEAQRATASAEVSTESTGIWRWLWARWWPLADTLV